MVTRWENRPADGEIGEEDGEIGEEDGEIGEEDGEIGEEDGKIGEDLSLSPLDRDQSTTVTNP